MTDNFINDFIKEYEKQPCLWQASCTDFKNRKKRQGAYLKLIEVAGKHGETYNIERTKQKINNLRCAFRVQLKKYTDCKNNPKNGKEEAYCPKRKYMESLMFLINEESKPVRRKSTNDTDDCQLIKRRNIDKEFYALTKSLESESEDNIEQNGNILIEQADTEQQKQNDSNENNNNSSNNNIICNEKMLVNAKIVLDDQQQLTTAAKSDDHNNIGEILWSNTVTELKSPTKSPPQQQQQNITIRPNVQARVVHVRTVKQSAVPVPVRQESQIINTTKKKLNNIVTNTPSIIKPVQKIRRLSAVIPSAGPSTVQVTSPSEKNFQKLITNTSSQPTTIPIVAISSPQATTTPTTLSTTISQESPAAIIITGNNTENKLTNNTVSSTCENLNKTDSNNFEKLLSLACTRVNQIADSEDEYGIFGKMVTCKLRRMDQDQALIAQKQITNILFDGQMKLLQLSGCSSKQQQISNSGVPQQLHSTTIRPIRSSSGTGHSFFISDLNGSHAISDEQSIHFNTLTGETQILGK